MDRTIFFSMSCLAQKRLADVDFPARLSLYSSLILSLSLLVVLYRFCLMRFYGYSLLVIRVCIVLFLMDACFVRYVLVLLNLLAVKAFLQHVSAVYLITLFGMPFGSYSKKEEKVITAGKMRNCKTV